MADQQQQPRRVSGKVVRFNDSRGYGFISPVAGGDDVFVHQTAIVTEEGYRTLNVGDQAEFTPEEEEGRLKAVDVVVVRRRKEVNGRKSVRSWGRTGGGDGCFKCGDLGHIAKDCERKEGGGELRREIECFNCGGIGHIGRDCPSGKNVKKSRPVVGSDCYNYGQMGHLARDFSKNGVETPRSNSNCNGGGGGNCYNCGELGHMARDCSMEAVKSYSEYGNKCFTCGELGHKARECRKGAAVKTYDSGNGGGCFKCGELGHWARDCVKAGGVENSNSNAGGGGQCFQCGKAGHWARECIYTAVPRRNNNGGGNYIAGKCFNCGQSGHRATGCPQPA